MKSLSLIDKAFLLKKSRLFESLDLDLLLAIADKTDLIAYNKGNSIFQMGQVGNQMYLIAEGKVAIQKQECVKEVFPVDFFGDEAIFNERARAYDAICLTDVMLLSISRTHLLAIILECPIVAISLLEAYTAHIDFRNR